MSCGKTAHFSQSNLCLYQPKGYKLPPLNPGYGDTQNKKKITDVL